MFRSFTVIALTLLMSTPLLAQNAQMNAEVMPGFETPSANYAVSEAAVETPPQVDAEAKAPEAPAAYEPVEKKMSTNTHPKDMVMMNMMMKKMHKMKGPEVVATYDGGVVVISNGKLVKYDEDLNFVNEVDLKKTR